MKDEQYRFHVGLRTIAGPPNGGANRVGAELPSPRYSRAGERAKLLKPLGTPSANSIKFYATSGFTRSGQRHRNWLVTLYKLHLSTAGSGEIVRAPSQWHHTALVP